MSKLLTGDIVIRVCRYNKDVMCIFRIARTFKSSIGYPDYSAHDIDILWENTTKNGLPCYECCWYNTALEMPHSLLYRRQSREKVKVQVKRVRKRC